MKSLLESERACQHSDHNTSAAATVCVSGISSVVDTAPRTVGDSDGLTAQRHSSSKCFSALLCESHTASSCVRYLLAELLLLLQLLYIHIAQQQYGVD